MEEFDNDENAPVFMKCTFCNLSLHENMDAILNHCTKCESRPRPSVSYKYTCFLCEYNTYYRESMRKHVRTHLGVKPYKCSMCNYSAAQKNTLKRHINMHLKQYPFTCSLCDFAATRCYSLTKHINEEHGVCKINIVN